MVLPVENMFINLHSVIKFSISAFVIKYMNIESISSAVNKTF